jgi:hypothetical protein
MAYYVACQDTFNGCRRFQDYPKVWIVISINIRENRNDNEEWTI